MSLTIGVLMQIAVSVQVADTIPAGTRVPVVVRATVNGNTAPRLTVPTATGASLDEVTDVTRLGGGFGQAVATREIRYLLRAQSPGAVVLSPVVATVGAQQAISVAKRIVVLPPPTNAVPAIVARAPISRQTLVNFHSLVTADTVWAGEQVTLQVGVFIDDELRSQLQRNPEYVAPSVDGAVAYDLPVANDALPSREVDGNRYRPFIFARALFPLRSGVMSIPPARLGYTIGVGTMYGRSERQTATTPARSVVVRELPVEGRPDSFRGAVGVYTVSAQVERGARVGDAVQLAVTLAGAGNVKLLPAPALNISGVTVNPAGESIVVDSTDLLIRGSKTFRYLLTPTRDGELALGDLRYAFFNPVRGQYEEAVVPLGALRVAAGTATVEEATEAELTPSLPLEPWRVAPTDDVTEQWWFRALFLLLGAPWLALMARRAYRVLPRKATRERRKSRRDAAPDRIVDAATLRRTFIHGLSPMVQLRPHEPFVVADVVRRLRRSGASTDAAEAAGALLDRLDRATFGFAASFDAATLATLEREATEMTSQLRDEMSTRVQERMRPVARSIALLLASASLLQAQPAAFARGVDAYGQRRFADAVVLFASAAAETPASSAAWTNLGAAQWMRADTAGAILAWQRAARLDPRGTSARRLLQEHGLTGDLRLTIVPVTPNVVWLLLLGVTGTLSVLGALWRWRQRPIRNSALLGAALVVGAFALLSVVAQRSASATDMVLIRRDVALRTEPVLAGEAGARARAGELAVVREARGTWRLLEVTGGRTGWVESEAVRSLAAGDGREVALAERRFASGTGAP